MSQIQQIVSSPDTSLNTARGLPPTQQAVAGDFGGNGLSELGQGAANLQAGNYEYQQRLKEQNDANDVTMVHVNMAQARQDFTTYFAQESQKADPNDPNFATNFKQQLSDYLDQTAMVAQTDKGRQTFSLLSAEMQTQFGDKADNYQAVLSSQNAKNNYVNLSSSLASTVMTDPTQYGSSNAQLEAAINDPNSIYARIPQADRDSLIQSSKNTMATAYVRGLINLGGNGPNLAQHILQNGGLDDVLEPNAKEELTKGAESAITTQMALTERQQAQAKRDLETQQQGTQLGLVTRIINPTATNGGTPTAAEISALSAVNPVTGQPGMTPEQVITTNDLIFTQARNIVDKTENQPHPAEENALTLQLYAATGDPDKALTIQPALDALSQGLINSREFDRINNRLQNLRDNSTNSFARDLNTAVGEASRQIGTSTAFIQNPGGAIDAINRMRFDAEAKADAYRKAGKDPRDLLNPANKDSPFNAASVNTYLTPPRQEVANQAAGVVASAQPIPVPDSMKSQANLPSTFDSQFQSAAQKYGVDAGDLKRLAITESSLQPNAANTKDPNGGSFGLMGVNLGSAPGKTIQQLHDPATNIDIGASIWKNALTEAGGDKNRAVEIYKGATSAAGKSRVSQLGSFISGIPNTVSALNTSPQEGTTQVSKSGKPMIFQNGAWAYK